MGRSIVVAGDLGFLLDTAKNLGNKLPAFMSAYRKLIHRYMHSRPIFTKYLNDQFVYVYEATSAQFARNVLHSTMVLSGAFEEAMDESVAGFEALHDSLPEPHSLGIGISSGELFVLRGTREKTDDYIGLPVYAAREMAKDAGEMREHILLDPAMELDRLCSEWLASGGLEIVSPKEPGKEEYAAQIVTPESILLQYRSDRERYHVVNAAEMMKEEIDRIARKDVFSFRLEKGERPHIELVFNPLNYRAMFDRSQASSILLAHISSDTLTLFPELLVPSDRIYTIQVPITLQQGYQVLFGLVVQAPESDLIDDELLRISDPGSIVERVEALRRLLVRAREKEKLAIGYYRF